MVRTMMEPYPPDLRNDRKVDRLTPQLTPPFGKVPICNLTGVTSLL